MSEGGEVKFEAQLFSQSCEFPSFTKGVRYSPDGTCVLAADDSNTLRVFEVPSSQNLSWASAVRSSEGETIYDYAWYPLMSSANPSTSVFASSSRDHPIHLFDAFHGSIRATYRAYDHLDEIVAAYSLAFTSNGESLIGGYNRCIRLFDIATPGRPTQTIHTSSTRKSRRGQRGIISALATSPLTTDLLVAGSYAGSIVAYDLNTGAPEIHFADARHGTRIGGVTKVVMSPDGRFVFSGSRKGSQEDESYVVCWDVRQSGREPLASYPRSGCTHQRLEFDVDSSGGYLVTGSTESQALIYDLSTGCVCCKVDVKSGGHAVNGVAFSPVGSQLALSTGTRTYPIHGDGESDCDDAGSDDGGVSGDMSDGDASDGGVDLPFQLSLYNITSISAQDPTDPAPATTDHHSTPTMPDTTTVSSHAGDDSTTAHDSNDASSEAAQLDSTRNPTMTTQASSATPQDEPQAHLELSPDPSASSSPHTTAHEPSPPRDTRKRRFSGSEQAEQSLREAEALIKQARTALTEGDPSANVHDLLLSLIQRPDDPPSATTTSSES